jgi:hypothetical protein
MWMLPGVAAGTGRFFVGSSLIDSYCRGCEDFLRFVNGRVFFLLLFAKQSIDFLH